MGTNNEYIVLVAVKDGDRNGQNHRVCHRIHQSKAASGPEVGGDRSLCAFFGGAEPLLPGARSSPSSGDCTKVWHVFKDVLNLQSKKCQDKILARHKTESTQLPNPFEKGLAISSHMQYLIPVVRTPLKMYL
jgi:hypothetical protein